MIEDWGLAVLADFLSPIHEDLVRGQSEAQVS
jgi:hypothetical protein